MPADDKPTLFTVDVDTPEETLTVEDVKDFDTDHRGDLSLYGAGGETLGIFRTWGFAVRREADPKEVTTDGR